MSSMTCVVAGDYGSTETPWTYNGDKVKNGSGVTVQGPLIGNDIAVFWLTFTKIFLVITLVVLVCTAKLLLL